VTFAAAKGKLKVKTPFNAIEKWFELDSKIFKENPIDFKNKLLFLKNSKQGTTL